MNSGGLRQDPRWLERSVETSTIDQTNPAHMAGRQWIQTVSSSWLLITLTETLLQMVERQSVKLRWITARCVTAIARQPGFFITLTTSRGDQMSRITPASLRHSGLRRRSRRAKIDHRQSCIVDCHSGDRYCWRYLKQQREPSQGPENPRHHLHQPLPLNRLDASLTRLVSAANLPPDVRPERSDHASPGCASARGAIWLADSRPARPRHPPSTPFSKSS